MPHQKGIPMKQIVFPAVTGLTPFEQQNLVSSTATFDRVLTQEEIDVLKIAVTKFHSNRPPNSRSAVFYLEFPASNGCRADDVLRGSDTMQFRVYSRYEMPTRQLFDGLLIYLTETLRINFPEVPASRPDLPVHRPPTHDSQPEPRTPFVRRGGRTFRPGDGY